MGMNFITPFSPVCCFLSKLLNLFYIWHLLYTAWAIQSHASQRLSTGQLTGCGGDFVLLILSRMKSVAKKGRLWFSCLVVKKILNSRMKLVYLKINIRWNISRAWGILSPAKQNTFRMAYCLDISKFKTKEQYLCRQKELARFPPFSRVWSTLHEKSGRAPFPNSGW